MPPVAPRRNIPGDFRIVQYLSTKRGRGRRGVKWLPSCAFDGPRKCLDYKRLRTVAPRAPARRLRDHDFREPKGDGSDSSL